MFFFEYPFFSSTFNFGAARYQFKTQQYQNSLQLFLDMQHS